MSEEDLVIAYVGELFSTYSRDDFQGLTFKVIKLKIEEKLQIDSSKYKELILAKLMEMSPSEESMEAENVATEKGNDKEEDEEEEDDDEDEEEEGELLGDEAWRECYGSIFFVKAKATYPWWPAYCFNPNHVKNLKIKLRGLKSVGKEHVVYNYGSNNYDYCKPENLRPYKGHEAEQLMRDIKTNPMIKSWQNSFAKAIENADIDSKKPKGFWSLNKSAKKKKVFS